MTHPSRRALLAAIATGVATAAAGCTPAPPPAFTMACGEAGGSYFRFGELLRAAAARRRLVMGIRASTGSAENLALLGQRRVDLAIAMTDAAVTVDGVVAIGRVYQNYLHCVVRSDGPVHALADLAGRRISVGAPGSGAAVTTRRVLELSKLTTPPHAVTVTELKLADAVSSLGSGGIAAFFWSGGVPTPQIAQLADRMPVRLLDLSPVAPMLSAGFPGLYLSTQVPSGVYGASRPVPTIGIANLLLSRPSLPRAIARALVDSLVEDARRLVPAEAVGIQYLTPSNLIDTSPISLHPAARERYRERYG